MAVINTTDVLDSSIFLKSKLSKNMVGDNYYIENAQYQREEKWEYMPNRIDIEEEKEKQINYTNEDPVYTPTEAVIQSIKDEKGKTLSSDYANLAFKSIKHPVFLGKRYRFSYDFEKSLQMSEEEKHLNSCVWIEINESKVKIGTNSIIRRCNSNIGMVGSPNLDYKNIVEYHYEPCILENDLKNMNIYYNKTLNLPNAEWYVIMQLNYFTNFIKIDDVLLLGGADLINKSNNSIYRVKAISKSCGDNTFFLNNDNNVKNIPLITLTLEKTVVDEGDNFEKRVSDNAPIYLVPALKSNENFNLRILKDNEINDNKYFNMCIGDEFKFSCHLYNNGQEIELNNVVISCSLNGTEVPQLFYEFSQDGNNFVIKDKKAYNRNNLIVTAKKDNWQDVIQIKLGGIY